MNKCPANKEIECPYALCESSPLPCCGTKEQCEKIRHGKKDRIHVICPVRGVSDQQQDEIDSQCKAWEEDGYEVHNPKYAVDQNDETGYNICKGHLESMREADYIAVWWDVNSKGSHFDLGMAFALGKKVVLMKTYQPDNDGKSYVKVMGLMG